jgi:hypothetical protein
VRAVLLHVDAYVQGAGVIQQQFEGQSLFFVPFVMVKSGCSSFARVSRMACSRSEESSLEQTGSSAAVATHRLKRDSSSRRGDILELEDFTKNAVPVHQRPFS